MHRCAANGDLEGIDRELASGTPIDLRDPESNTTPLMHAVASERVDVSMVIALIDRGADVNANSGDCTVLYRAIRAGHLAKIELLLNRGADVRYVRSQGYDALIDA